MSLWKITTTRSVTFNDVSIESGMSVEVVSIRNGPTNPMSILGNNHAINDAFKRKYGIDLARAGLLSPNYLSIEMVGGTPDSDHREMTKKESIVATLLNLFS